MDSELIAQKLESLRRCMQRLEDKRPSSAEQLERDIDAQDIIALNLTRAVQLCVDMGTHVIASKEIPAPATMGQTFDSLVEIGYITTEIADRLKKAVGFRNIAVHNYETIDWHIVYAIVTQHLTDFKNYANAINQRL